MNNKEKTFHKMEMPFLDNMLRGRLAMLVLSELSIGDLSGYQLMKNIEMKTGWKPSAGSMYPLLKGLLSEGLLSVKRENCARVKKQYSLTAKGREFEKSAKESERAKNEMVKRVMKDIGILRCFEKSQKEGDSQMKGLFSALSMKMESCPEIHEEVIKLNLMITKMLAGNSATDKKMNRIKNVLSSANKSLSRL
ncbi:MAG: PadR family transcriptional regulator [Candidatus Woesearchaeota archaeon]|nr:PadR family transcriptional regulator [Candidatus Woesearchaeota archaeon]